MLHSLDKFQQRCAREYEVQDLTMVVAVRAHDGNPWVKERLRVLGDYYAPAPQVVIVDFGSAEPHRKELETLAEANSFTYRYVDDSGTFCLAKARNVGALAAQTDLLLFSDIDCFGERDLCARLVRYANVINLGAVYDQIIKMPVYHLAEELSSEFFELAGQDERSRLIARGLADSVYAARGDVAEFVDPSSNFFVCHRAFYDQVGGYNESFRGHGSEDYEFLLRFAMISGQFPAPAAPGDDIYGPMRDGFYGPKVFRGFRRLGELMSYHAELSGLRIAHLFHGRPPNRKDAWYDENDWGRARFYEEVDPFLENPMHLLSKDWMPRDKTAAVLLRHAWHYEFYLPLRAAGYRLVPITTEDLARDGEALDFILSGDVDAVAIFNPFMSSHAELRITFDKAVAEGLEPIVVERGALPESWYYARTVAYDDPSWSAESLDAYTPDDEERAIATDYGHSIRSGEHTLEENGVLTQTLDRYASLARRYETTCLIPLQVDQDMAVTRFTEGYQPYPAFRDSLREVASNHPDVLFLIKPHPLASTAVDDRLENVVVCTADDNIHALIELSEVVITYNSGVGLLALLHQRKLITVGNAYYNIEGLGRRARDFAEAVDLATRSSEDFLTRDLPHFVAWLLFRKYSFFSADSLIRDFGVRRSHEYRNLRCYQLSGPSSESRLRARVVRPFSATSYASARVGVQIDDGKLLRAGLAARSVVARLSPRPFTPAGKVYRGLRKLRRNPAQFFADSRHAPLRWIGRTFASDDDRSE